jgi:hypothetical protein
VIFDHPHNAAMRVSTTVRARKDVLYGPHSPSARLLAGTESAIGPVKVQQRSSGGCWRTIDGLADFALIQSCLSTAAKWGISKLDALRDLFNSRAWLPPGLEPAG